MKKTEENRPYWPENYKAPRNAKPVFYNGIQYQSMKQCMMEGVSANTVKKAMRSGVPVEPIIEDIGEKTPEQILEDYFCND